MKKISKLGFPLALSAICLLGLSTLAAPPADAMFPVLVDPPCPALSCSSLSGFTHVGYCNITHPSEPECVTDCQLWKNYSNGVSCYGTCADV